MCAKLKAQNYAYMVDEGSLSCMDALYEYLPVFSDIYKYCYSGARWLAGSAAALAALSVLF